MAIKVETVDGQVLGGRVAGSVDQVGSSAELRRVSLFTKCRSGCLDGPGAECPEVVTAHLVAGSGVNTGIVDLEAHGSVQTLVGPLTALVK